MYTTEEISAIVARFAALHKDWVNKRNQSPIDPVTKERVNVSQYPEYWEGYNFAAKLLDSILPHSRPDVYPEHLLSVRAPNQTEQQAAYIKANYKASTLSVFEDFRSTVSRAFADQNWSIKYNAERSDIFGDETFQNYVNREIEKFGSVEMFSKNLLPTLKLVDANGIIAIEPKGVTVAYNEEGEPVEGNDLIKPMPVYYSCKKIVGQKYGHYYLVISDEYSTVKEGSKNVKSGLCLYFFDDTAMYIIEQVGKKDDWTFGQPEIVYQYDLGYVPCIKLMGTPQLIGNELAFSSPFTAAVPLLDQVVLDNSYLQMSKATSAFPFMVAIGDICEFTDKEGNKCNDGYIFDAVNGGNKTCPSCSGSGLKSRFSPSGMLLIKPKTNLSEGDGLSGDYVKFVSPPMDTLTFLRDEIEKMTAKARSVLHLPSSDEAANGGEGRTATGSLNKLRALHAFLKPISDQIFTIYEFMLTTIGEMRYGDEFGGVQLVYPTTFDVSTPADYLSMIAEGIESGVPPAVTYANVYNYIKAINYTDEESTAMYELIMQADELLLMSSADIIARVANGTIEKWQDVLHNSGPQLIMGLMRNHIETEDARTFFDLPMQTQIDQLKQAATDTIREQLDPIQVAANQLLNGLN